MSAGEQSELRVDLQLTRGTFNLQVNFSVPAAGVTAIFGRSGAGKSSLLQAIAGLLPARGCVHVGSNSWQDEHKYLPAHQRPVGYVFQDGRLFPHLNVRGNLEYGMRRRHDAVPADYDFDHAVALLRLDDLLQRMPQQLSGGEQQRVAIGRALLSNPALLLMDEPLASLDAGHKRELLGYLQSLQRKTALPVLYVSHAADEVARLADHLVLLDKGRKLADGPVNEMLTRLDLPLTLDSDAAAVLSVTCTGYDAPFDLTSVALGSNTLYLPGKLSAAPGDTLRLRVLARDVSLTMERQSGTSILNIVAVRIIELREQNPAQCIVQLDTGSGMLLACVTRKSAAALQLRPGQQVYAQIKSMALPG